MGEAETRSGTEHIDTHAVEATSSSHKKTGNTRVDTDGGEANIIRYTGTMYVDFAINVSKLEWQIFVAAKNSR